MLAAGSVCAETPTPHRTPSTPTVASTATVAGAAQASSAVSSAAPRSTPTCTMPSASPTPDRRADAASADESADATGTTVGTGANDATAAPVATAAPGPPRAFRTPERSAPQAFVARDAGTTADGGATAPVGPGGGMGTRPSAPRAQSGLVVFRATARTALEGFDLRVSYPPDTGSFGTAAQQPDCNAGSGAYVVANDRGTGELRLLVASASPLPFPLDVFCRFTLAGGSALDPSAFAVRVAEVTNDGKRADPSLLLVSIAVR